MNGAINVINSIYTLCEGEIPAVVERMTMLRVCDMVSVSVVFPLVGGLKVMLLDICG